MNGLPSDLCDVALVKRYLDNACSAAEQAALEQHLSDCEQCQEQMRELSGDWGSAKEFLATDTFDQHVDAASVRTATIGEEEATQDTREFQHDGLRRVLELLAPTDDPRMLGRIGCYEIVGAIGFGGMAVVLKGFEPTLNRFVAIKVLAPHLAASKSARERFSREARAAASVLHPNVIAIHNVDEFQHLPYLVMPYISGGSLRDRLNAEGKLDIPAVLRIGMQVAAGLSAAHEQGLVHRDIKPANILLEPGLERVVITDFGLARAADDASITRTGILAGTPHYMSPEQAKGEPVRHPSDLFSLGSLLFTLVAGRVPFDAESSYGILRKVIETDAPDPRAINPEVPDWLARLIKRLHRREMSERFQSAREVSDLLRQCLASEQQAGTSIPDALLPPKKKWSLVPVIAVTLLATLLVGWFAWSWWSPSSDSGSQGIAAQAAWPKDGKWATIRGRFVWDGPLPVTNQIEATRDRELYQEPIYDESLLIHPLHRGVANVFVWLEDESLHSKTFPALVATPDAALLQFDQGRIEPHAAVVRTQQTLRLRNRDPIRHYVSFGNFMNVSLPGGELFANEFPADATPMKVACEVHPWFASYVLVRDHAYATLSDSDGAFTLEKVPAGKWRMRVWHEVLGEIKVTEHPCLSAMDGEISIRVDRPQIVVDWKLASPSSR